MPERNGIELETPVTTVIQQHPLPDAVARYEEWLKEVIPVAQTFTGHQGVNVIRPQVASEPYTIILHFETVANLRKWLDSETRALLVEKIRPFLRGQENLDIKTGFEFWFTPPPGGRPAKRYKQFLITLSAIFPLTIVVPWSLQPLFGWIPLLGLPVIRHLLVAALIVGIVVYVVMPRYTQLVSRWLFR
ncbi:antibiotic biosynthesis monooxygenase [Mesorhizobium sp. B2-4-17]|nr:antibiotic biosynthesis monooxygenase [Mesorhizobium sp. B2-4-17]